MMLLSAQDAKRFMVTYERVAIAVLTIGGIKMPADPKTCLARAREQLQDSPELLAQAVSFLEQRNTPVDQEVVEALGRMRVAKWVHLKDLRSGAVFLNLEGSEAYSVACLTEQPVAIIGSRGYLVETGLCAFAGRIVCDGVFIASVQLAPGLWSEFHKRYRSLKAAGCLHRDPTSVPAWQQPASASDQAMDSEPGIEILDPWLMVPLEVVDAALEFLEARLQPHHPLREQSMFPMLKREDAQIWVVTKEEDDGTMWLLDLTKKRRLKGRTIYSYRQLDGDDDLQALIQQDHQLWLDSFPDDDDDY
jgi:hypothetical protein